MRLSTHNFAKHLTWHLFGAGGGGGGVGGAGGGRGGGGHVI